MSPLQATVLLLHMASATAFAAAVVPLHIYNFGFIGEVAGIHTQFVVTYMADLVGRSIQHNSMDKCHHDLMDTVLRAQHAHSGVVAGPNPLLPHPALSFIMA